MKQGEVWLINLDPTIGAEIKKTRPDMSEIKLAILPISRHNIMLQDESFFCKEVNEIIEGYK